MPFSVGYCVLRSWLNFHYGQHHITFFRAFVSKACRTEIIVCISKFVGRVAMVTDPMDLQWAFLYLQVFRILFSERLGLFSVCRSLSSTCQTATGQELTGLILPGQYPARYLIALPHPLNCNWKPQTCVLSKPVGSEAPRVERIKVVLVLSVLSSHGAQWLLGTVLVGGVEGLAVVRGKQRTFALLHVKMVLTLDGDFETELNVLP